jgi:hypothetical protein
MSAGFIAPQYLKLIADSLSITVLWSTKILLGGGGVRLVLILQCGSWSRSVYDKTFEGRFTINPSLQKK